MSRAWNFSAGPALLPEPVLRQLRDEGLEWGDAGATAFELSHRGAAYLAMAERTEADLRALLGLDARHAVLFLSGGATTQQALIPLNLAAAGASADYLDTGHWSQVALRQAEPAVRTRVIASAADAQYRAVPPPTQWKRDPAAAYLHVTGNETIHGVELFALPDTGAVPLVADLSSNIASRPMDYGRIALAYAGAQKNLGPAGITVVVIRRDLLERAGQPRARIFQYAAHAAAGSMLNTPPTWNWYALGLCVRWMLEEGGTAEFARRNLEKSALLYAAIDGSGGFYRNAVVPAARSRMNVPFALHDPALDAAFLAGAQAAGLIGLKGHTVLGGLRASLYNAMPLAGVQALVAYLNDFMRRHG